jgi:cytochrome c biogenesis protein CcmG/thiol:disulfide interchange protein DsbE
MEENTQGKKDNLSPNLLLLGLLVIVGALLLHKLSPQPGTDSQSSVSENTIEIPPPAIRGTPAPDVELTDMEGNQVQLAAYFGKVLLVNFWATWCSPCLIEIPWFIEFQEAYGSDGFQVLAISLDQEGPEIVIPYMEKYHMASLDILMGSDSTPDEFGGLLGLPTTFMVDRQGKLYSKHQGLVSKEDLEDEIQLLLNAEPSKQTAVL